MSTEDVTKLPVTTTDNYPPVTQSTKFITKHTQKYSFLTEN